MDAVTGLPLTFGKHEDRSSEVLDRIQASKRQDASLPTAKSNHIPPEGEDEDEEAIAIEEYDLPVTHEAILKDHSKVL